MTVTHLNGNLLSLKYGIIAHQENTLGVHGAGIALQLTRKYPYAMTAFENYTKTHTDLLGQVYLTNTNGSNVKNTNTHPTPVQIANLYGQANIGKSKRQTDYPSLKHALKITHTYAKQTHRPVAIPAFLGCGLAGGDWDNVILPMLKEIFNDDVKLLIYHYHK